jgi:hypothetical protein
MRCLSCNAALNDFESTRKSVVTAEYIDLCEHCFSTVADDILTVDREDLAADDFEIEKETAGDIHHCGLDGSVDNYD